MSDELTPEQRVVIQWNHEAARAKRQQLMQHASALAPRNASAGRPQAISTTSSMLPPRGGIPRPSPSQNAPSQSSQALTGTSQGKKPHRVALQMHTARTFATTQNTDLARQVYSRVPGACYVEAERTWTFPLAQYDAVLVRLAEAGVRLASQDAVPANVLSMFSAEMIPEPPARSSATGAVLAAAMQYRARMAEALPDTPITEVIENPFAERDALLDERIGEPELAKTLHLFQRDAVEDIVFRRNGRVLLADDMGLGKTLQATAVALCFRADWPMLIVAPASMVATWAEQLARWAPTHLPRNRTAVLYDGKASVPMDALAVVASYDIASRAVGPGGSAASIDFSVVIADESHALKNTQTKRAASLLPVLNRARRVVLLSGTPALSRPNELWAQIRAVAPRLYTSAHAFGLRYCAGHRGRFGWDFRGASNLRELELVLRRAVLIRRTKDEVLAQLPPKVRTQRFLAVGRRELEAYRAAALSERARELYESGMVEDPAALASQLAAPLDVGASGGADAMEIWRQTAEVKLPAACAYVDDLLEVDAKILLFAHHMSVLNGLATHLSSAGVRFVRIDGATPPAKRGELCSIFQSDPSVRAAVLSVTAASTGLTLTAASVVVFAELFWNPGVLLQAEDRAHRIGQADSVTVHYLLARGTADDHLWPLLQRKLATLEAVGLGRNAFAGMASSNAVPTGDPTQRTITSYFAPVPKRQCLGSQPRGDTQPNSCSHAAGSVFEDDLPEDLDLDDDF